MRVYFSTVVRTAPLERGGEVVCLDWRTKRVVARAPIVPTNPALDDPNPRGNTRGGRGIVLRRDEVVVASYHTLHVFDGDLTPRRNVTNGLLVGVHELAAASGSIWAASTAIDAAVQVDVQTGLLQDARWPREMPGIREALNVEPLSIDKAADNRARFLERSHAEHPHHLHLNALAVERGGLFALLHAPGAIANLDRDEIAVRDAALWRAHNLLIREDGVAIVNDTDGQTIRFYQLDDGRLLDVWDLTRHRWVRALARTATVRHRVRTWLARRGVSGMPAARPLFVRGLARAGGRLFVGISPASILELDERTGELCDAFQYARDVHAAVHGLQVAA